MNWRPKMFDGEQNRLFLDPIFKGEYPADVLKRHHELAGRVCVSCVPAIWRPSTRRSIF